MKHSKSLSIILVALCSGSACSNEKSEVPIAAKSSEAEAASAAPFSGELTAAVINSANGVVRPFDAWSTGFAKLKGKMGEPTFVEGNQYYWGVLSNGECTFLYVSQDNEAEYFKDKPDPQDMVGTVSNATTAKKTTDDSWKQCIKAAGVKAEDLEDPNAPTPPAEGISSIDDFRGGIAGAESKWIGVNVTLEGVLLSVSTSSSTGSDEKTTTLSIASELGAQESVGCTLLDGSQAKGIKQGDTLKIQGKANSHFGGGLDDCTLITE